RLPEREGEGVVAQAERLAVDLGGPARVVAEDLGRERDLDLARVEHGLAGAEALEPGHLVEVLLDQIAEAPDDAPALVRRHLRPRALVEGLAGRGHRQIDVPLVPLADRPDRLLVGRVDRRVALPRERPLPLPRDEDLSRFHARLLLVL